APDARPPGLPPTWLGLRAERGRLADGRVQGRRARPSREPAWRRSHRALRPARGHDREAAGAHACPTATRHHLGPGRVTRYSAGAHETGCGSRGNRRGSPSWRSGTMRLAALAILSAALIAGVSQA